MVLFMILLGARLTGRYEKIIYQLMSEKPVTPNEVARKFEISHKTALRSLMRLALTKDDIHYKNSGRIHLFWKRDS